MTVRDEHLLRKHVATPWTEDRARVVQTALVQRLRRARVRRAGLGIVAALFISAAAAWWLQRPGAIPASTVTSAPLQPPPQVPPNDLSLALDDAATVAALEPQQDLHALVRLVDESAAARTWRLLGKGARFEVRANDERHFRLQVDAVLIDVLGGAFRVVKVGQGVRVQVENQSAVVSWQGGTRELLAGQSAVFPPKTARAAGHQRWQGLAKRGRFEEAFLALQQAIAVDGKGAVPDEPGALLLAADAARLSRHPEKALPHLQRFVQRFPTDPRASLAAFTMGLVLLEELGRPRDAALAFAKSRKMSPAGDLTEDAWAREAEASFRAGDEDRARQAAEEYLRHFPNGRRATAVRRYGAIE